MRHVAPAVLVLAYPPEGGLEVDVARWLEWQSAWPVLARCRDLLWTPGVWRHAGAGRLRPQLVPEGLFR